MHPRAASASQMDGAALLFLQFKRPVFIAPTRAPNEKENALA